MQNHRTKLTRKQFDAYKVAHPSNLVIVEMPPEKDLLTESGVKLNFNPDTLYAEGNDSHVADVCPVSGIVVKVVDKLYFSRRDVDRTMMWETDMELKVGDEVWFHPLIAKNCDEVEVDGTVYKIIPFEDCFIARRGDEVICLNGNVLLEPVMLPKISELDVLDKDIDKTRGIVAFNGSDVKRYMSVGQADMPNLQKGDLVAIQKDAYIYFLERFRYNSHFDGGKQYICIQKRFVEAVL